MTQITVNFTREARVKSHLNGRADLNGVRLRGTINDKNTDYLSVMDQLSSEMKTANYSQGCLDKMVAKLLFKSLPNDSHFKKEIKRCDKRKKDPLEFMDSFAKYIKKKLESGRPLDFPTQNEILNLYAIIKLTRKVAHGHLDACSLFKSESFRGSKKETVWTHFLKYSLEENARLSLGEKLRKPFKNPKKNHVHDLVSDNCDNRAIEEVIKKTNDITPGPAAPAAPISSVGGFINNQKYKELLKQKIIDPNLNQLAIQKDMHALAKKIKPLLDKNVEVSSEDKIYDFHTLKKIHGLFQELQVLNSYVKESRPIKSYSETIMFENCPENELPTWKTIQAELFKDRYQAGSWKKLNTTFISKVKKAVTTLLDQNFSQKIKLKPHLQVWQEGQKQSIIALRNDSAQKLHQKKSRTGKQIYVAEKTCTSMLKATAWNLGVGTSYIIPVTTDLLLTCIKSANEFQRETYTPCTSFWDKKTRFIHYPVDSTFFDSSCLNRCNKGLIKPDHLEPTEAKGKWWRKLMPKEYALLYAD